MQKLVIFSGLVFSVSCMVLHQAPVPVTIGLQYYDTPNYKFQYEVNDANTGDIKNQQESRRGDTVLGQYSLLQPDGVRRTVDYRADEYAGFRATVNNEAEPIVSENDDVEARQAPVNTNQALYAANTAYTRPTSTTQAPPAPVAISRSSIVQTFSSPIRVPTHGNIYYGNRYNAW